METHRKVKIVATKAATPATMVTARAKRLPVPPAMFDSLPMMETGESEAEPKVCSMLATLFVRTGHVCDTGSKIGRHEYACLGRLRHLQQQQER